MCYNLEGNSFELFLNPVLWLLDIHGRELALLFREGVHSYSPVMAPM